MRVALITARGGSKGLPGKNILPMMGVPLIGWSIKAALDVPSVDQCYVSSDDESILKIASELGSQVIQRPRFLAEDDSSSEDVIAHFIGVLKESGVEVDEILLLQPTSPIRTSKHISEAIELFNKGSIDCVISVFEPKHCPAKAYKIGIDGCLVGLLSESAPYTPRQKLPRAFLPNGAIYLFKASAFLRENGIPKKNVCPYMMTPEDSIDIDDLSDFQMAEAILRKRYETGI